MSGSALRLQGCASAIAGGRLKHACRTVVCKVCSTLYILEDIGHCAEDIGHCAEESGKETDRKHHSPGARQGSHAPGCSQHTIDPTAVTPLPSHANWGLGVTMTFNLSRACMLCLSFKETTA